MSATRVGDGLHAGRDRAQNVGDGRQHAEGIQGRVGHAALWRFTDGSVAPVDFGGMFREDVDQSLESNMDDIQLKQKAGGGIADNLAKLKKLKGGG